MLGISLPLLSAKRRPIHLFKYQRKHSFLYIFPKWPAGVSLTAFGLGLLDGGSATGCNFPVSPGVTIVIQFMSPEWNSVAKPLLVPKSPHSQSDFLFLNLLLFYLVWLHWVLVAACGIFIAVACPLLVAAAIQFPDLGSNPAAQSHFPPTPPPPTLEMQNLSQWTTREVLSNCLSFF